MTDSAKLSDHSTHQTATQWRPRRRKPPRRAEVRAVSQISPRLVSVLVTGDELDGFADAAPTAHLKVFLPAAGPGRAAAARAGPDGHGRSPTSAAAGRCAPTRRAATTRRRRRWRSSSCCTATGPASEWAERAKPGDEIAVAGPGGRFSLEPDAERWWIAADESAHPGRRHAARGAPGDGRRRGAPRGRRPRRRDRVRRARPRRRSPGTTGAPGRVRRRAGRRRPRAGDRRRHAGLGGVRGGRDARHPPLLHSRARPARQLAGHPGLLAHRRAQPPRPRLRRGLRPGPARGGVTGRRGRRCARGAGRRGRSGGRTPRSCARGPRAARPFRRRAWCRAMPRSPAPAT